MDKAAPVVGMSYAITYEAAYQALRTALDRMGGIRKLVLGKAVAIKVNWSGWGEKLLGSPAVESYVVHGRMLYALVATLISEGARRVQILESAPTLDDLATFAERLGCDVPAMAGLGDVEFINTRSGDGHPYVRLPVYGGRLFDWIAVHRAYSQCEVFVSLAKMKNHAVTGVTLSLKNLCGILPNTRYGLDAPSPDAVKHRQLIHDRRGVDAELMPGERIEMAHFRADVRVPSAVVDICSARRIDLSVIDGICTVAGGEGPWTQPHTNLRLLNPGIVIVGRDPVATDAVTTAVMGYDDPLSTHLPPFDRCENHLLMAQKAGLGVADLSRINVHGIRIQDARTPFS